ncbi:hypothetical protein [Mangrovimonas xylaniphaga]|uniref:hypothetical protein n=1 Tax=Mangrovimonas xylaniphaga TaxID=1645915 RepID=UPI0006B5899E|nr:hypothetical protein [Mangrovimonas xylaniphaga]
MKPTLSIEEIQFIDTYLKNSDVRFADIRMEMVDHVASEIEVRMSEDGIDFYNAFKWYMAENKKSLIKESRQYYRSADKKLLKQLAKNICSWRGVLVVLGSYFLVKIMWAVNGSNYLRHFPIFLTVSLPLLYLIDYKVYKRRYSYLERIGLYVVIYYQIANPFFPSFSRCLACEGDMAIFKISLGVAVPFLLLQLGFQNYQFYKKKYETIS